MSGGARAAISVIISSCSQSTSSLSNAPNRISPCRHPCSAPPQASPVAARGVTTSGKTSEMLDLV